MGRVVLGTEEAQSAGGNREVGRIWDPGIIPLGILRLHSIVVERQACNLLTSARCIIFTVYVLSSLVEQNRSGTVCQYFVP